MDKTFDAAAAEPRIYAAWQAAGAFAAGANARPGAETFCIVIPPPNVTGSLHMGHALNNTLQDILIRWHRMRGFDTLWQPGTDHAGIATQMVVERQLAADQQPSRREMGRGAFVEKVWEWKAQSGGTITNQLKRLGASCDWSRERFTMDEGLSRAVLKVFVELYDKGLIYKDKRLVNWDPMFETAISDLEVEQVEEQGHLWRFRYPLADGKSYRWPTEHDEDGTPTAWEERDYIVVATTRPETMLGDTGVAVHPDDARYAALVGKHVILPLVLRRMPIVADKYADPEKGTGAVKMTPAHDFNDFQVGKRQGLRAINVMTTRAAIWLENNVDFHADCEPSAEAMALDGLDRFAARKRIVELARDQGWLDGIDDEVHVVPHGDRSKVPVEPYLTDQWFVDAATLAKPALEAVRNGDTKFVPGNWDKTYFNWLENIEPWCISRQLWWGHQIPVWYGASYRDYFKDGKVVGQRFVYDGDAVFCAPTFGEASRQAEDYYRKSGVAITVAGEVSDANEAFLLSSEAVGETNGKDAYYLWRDPDVLDTWFSSALWPFSTLGWPDQTPELERYYKTDVLITGFDIIFFWVARMMMTGLEFMHEVPFHTVYINSIVVDGDGQKMSKSLGNVIDPLDLVDQYGADALRYTLASQEVQGRRQLRLSVDQVEAGRNFATKLWNAARFAEMNECRPVADFDPAGVTQPVNRWIVGETMRIAHATDAALGACRFNEAAIGLHAHVWGVFCDWYVELSKPVLQGRDEAARAETRATMAWALDHCLILLHPIMPFVTEALWGQIADRDAMLIHGNWPDLAETLADGAADQDISWAIRLIEGIRSVRAEMNVPPAAELELVLTGHNADTGQRLLRIATLIKRLARLVEVAVADKAPDGSVTVAMEDCAAHLPLKGVIDVAAETARLEKALAKGTKDIAQIEGKLGNEKFLAKAPEAVVAEQRDRREAALAEKQRLDAALARLKGMS